MSLAPLVRAMGRGPSRGRSLTRAEAREAMRLILDGEAAPEAVGALLMLMRYRGETAGEVAGFTEAARARITGWAGLGVTLDWPSYAAGRSRGLPWFLLSAMLLARSGQRVLIHGWNSHQNPDADVRAACRRMAIPLAGSPDPAAAALDRGGLVYVPVEALDPRILDLLRLREVLGLRSAVNTVCRMLNPAGAATAVQGVFHPPYRQLQQDAAALLGQRDLVVLKGGGGEFERNPAKQVELIGLAAGVPVEEVAPPLLDAHRRLSDAAPDAARMPALWQGELADPHALAIVTGTAALALRALDRALTGEAAQARAEELWRTRHDRIAA